MRDHSGSDTRLERSELFRASTLGIGCTLELGAGSSSDLFHSFPELLGRLVIVLKARLKVSIFELSIPELGPCCTAGKVR